MIYELSRKTFGTKHIVDLLQVETPEPINDICYVDGLGIVCSTGKSLGLITQSGASVFPWKSEVNTNTSFGFLSCMDYNSEHGILLVAEDGGRNVRSINVRDDSIQVLVKKQSVNFMETLLKKTPKETPAYIGYCGIEQFVILLPSLRKCFKFRDSMFEHVAGDGQCRFTTGSNAIGNSIGQPSGLAVQNNKVFISDSLRNVIRVMDGESISLFFGHPQQNVLNGPSKIVIIKNTMYILCSDSIRTLMTENKIGGNKSIYTSDNIQSIAADEEGGLYILEEKNA